MAETTPTPSPFDPAAGLSWRSRDTTAPFAATGPVLLKAATDTPEPTPPVSEDLADWLARLTLLYGVPFEYLVPDPSMLPKESLRFFHIDDNWTARLLDGALSTGLQTTADAIAAEAMHQAVRAPVATARAALRFTLRRKPLPQDLAVSQGRAGLLLRSAVVSGWPGLELLPTRDGQPVAILRMDRLASDVLIALFAQVPDAVALVEPGEGLHFGLRDDPHQAGSYVVSLRGLGFGGYPAGEQIMQGGEYLTAPVPVRGGADQPPGVIDITGAVASVTAALPPGALGSGGRLTSGGFALQYLRAAGRQDYTISAGAICPGDQGSEG